jgi:threonine dehydratase
MDLYDQVLHAVRRIGPLTRETYLEYSPALRQISGATVALKLENLQYTGSFKVRGALNKVLSLTDQERALGVVAASTGNHGLAVAYSLRQVDGCGVVFTPQTADPSKVAAIERVGGEVRMVGTDSVETEYYARQYASQHGKTYISPYNDPVVVAGQGTVGWELSRQAEAIDAVFVSLGGGGLISGIASYLKRSHPSAKIIGCSPENSQVMIQSVRAGRILELPSLPTLSDGTAGGVEANAITFKLCQRLVDDYETVTEEEIGESLRLFLNTHHMLIEGSAAVAVAAFLKRRHQFAGKHVVIILCGANISLETLCRVLSAGSP